MIIIWFVSLLVVAKAAETGKSFGCFRKEPHSLSKYSIENCFEFCKFYRYVVFFDNTCSCENIIKGNEESSENCKRKCQNTDEFLCGGDGTESFYETGSKLPGSVRNLKTKESTGDKITVEFDPPERNSSLELTGYEITAIVTRTFASNPWTINNKTFHVNTGQQKFDLSGLLSASTYLIKIKSKNGDLDGDQVNLTARTRLSEPYPQPATPKILEKSGTSAKIQIKRFDNENGPVTKYLVIVSTTENSFIKNDFRTELLTSYKNAQEDGIPYYITAEIEPFREDTKVFTVGDGRTSGVYYNAPIENLNEEFKVMIGIVSKLDGEKKTSYSNFTEAESAPVILHYEEPTKSFSVIFLMLACILCGVFLLSSIVYYGYLRIKRARGRPRSERHEMSLQGPILELDNNGFISCESDNNGINFRDKLFSVLSDLEPHQKISRKSLSLDIDDIMGIGNFGDVIKGQMSENNAPAQVHVVSDDIDRHYQMKLLHDLQQVISTDHPNLLAFHGVCQTHDWFFIVFEDIPQTLKQFLVSQRGDQQRPSIALSESVALQFMFDLSSVLEYLKCNKIVHKNLNSYNIRVKRQSGNFKILLSMFGPTLFAISDDGTKQTIDEERWYAPEALRFNKFSHISDMYSCALIFWEISTLGGTIYQTIPTADIFIRVKKGIRPEKFDYISDDLYQLMLNCWELEPSQRVHDYTMILSQIKHFLIVPHHYLNFSAVGALPFYMPLLEIKN